MNNQVLLVEQMQELIDMGIDTSNASCIWWNFADLGFALMFLNDGRESLTIEKMKENHGAENIVPAFTLQDILTLLEPCHRTMVIKHEPNEWLDSAFNLLKLQYRNN